MGLCAVVPLGRETASVANPKSKVTAGVAVRIPTLYSLVFKVKTAPGSEPLASLVTNKLEPSIFKLLVVREVKAPKLVIFPCAAVPRVPVIAPEAARVVKLLQQ